MATLADHLVRDYVRNHDRVIEVVGRVDERAFQTSIAPSIHSLAYQLWHVARWADVFAVSLARENPALAEATYPGEVVEIWAAEGLSERWGLPSGEMGRRDTGMTMDDAAADGLVVPERETLVDYAKRSFRQAEAVVGAIPDRELLQPAPGDPEGDSYADNILIYAEHDSRHLGMMETIVGLLGTRGSATR